MCRSNETKTTSKEETWSRGTNSRLPFDVNVVLNLSINSHVYASLRSMAVCLERDWAANPQKRAWTESEAARKMKTFQVAPAPISSRFLCPRLPLLFSAPNQNRHPTQATFTPNGKREVFPLVVDRLLFKIPLSQSIPRADVSPSLFSFRDIKLGKHACDSSMRRGNKSTLRGFRLVIHLILR